MRLLTIGEVARELDISVEWLQKPERDGRIPEAKRNINGWRVYIQDDLEHLRKILIPIIK